ncbi:DMP19 family protein [Dyadobacter sp. OTU695]|uniref:DMP19 family protein n=1 Tax=Dyadobacter sp. OTU695 TaxID=3043860 RepID=UPI00313F1E6F
MRQIYPLIVFTMFAGFYYLFGCAEKSKQENDLSKQMRKQGARSAEAFKNRTIHKILTSPIIDSTSDDDLLQVVFDNLSEKLPTDYEKEYETVLGWNKSRQAIYMVWILEGEVNNGGYNQFYFNSGGQFRKHLPDALRRVNAIKTADLTLAANDSYEKQKDKITKHQDGSLEGFSKSYEDNPLNGFDEQFYALSEIENLQKLQVDFIRKHKPDFIDQ